MLIKFNKQLYSKAAILKAAFHFTDKSYIHIRQNDSDYLIDIVKKNVELSDNVYNEFKNEVLIQSVHHFVSNETKTIRNIIMGRALASTALIPELANDETNYESQDIDDVLKDWFDNAD